MTSLCRSKISTYCSRILKWNAGVRIFRRWNHFLPIPTVKRHCCIFKNINYQLRIMMITFAQQQALAQPRPNVFVLARFVDEFRTAQHHLMRMVINMLRNKRTQWDTCTAANLLQVFMRIKLGLTSTSAGFDMSTFKSGPIQMRHTWPKSTMAWLRTSKFSALTKMQNKIP